MAATPKVVIRNRSNSIPGFSRKSFVPPSSWDDSFHRRDKIYFSLVSKTLDGVTDTDEDDYGTYFCQWVADDNELNTVTGDWPVFPGELATDDDELPYSENIKIVAYNFISSNGHFAWNFYLTKFLAISEEYINNIIASIPKEIIKVDQTIDSQDLINRGIKIYVQGHAYKDDFETWCYAQDNISVDSIRDYFRELFNLHQRKLFVLNPLLTESELLDEAMHEFAIYCSEKADELEVKANEGHSKLLLLWYELKSLYTQFDIVPDINKYGAEITSEQFQLIVPEILMLQCTSNELNAFRALAVSFRDGVSDEIEDVIRQIDEKLAEFAPTFQP